MVSGLVCALALFGQGGRALLDDIIESTTLPNGHVVRRAKSDAFMLIGEQHPELYAKAVKIVFTTPGVDHYAAIDWLRFAKLDAQSKRNIFRFIVQHGGALDRYVAVDGLYAYDPALLERVIREALAAIVRPPKGTEDDKYRLDLAGCAILEPTPAIENAYRLALRRCDVYQRACLLGYLGDGQEPSKMFCLRLLRPYLDDETPIVRKPNDPDEYFFEWSRSSPPLPTWRAALQFGEVEWSLKPTPTECARLRQEVKAKIDLRADLERAVGLWREYGMPIPSAQAVPVDVDDDLFVLCDLPTKLYYGTRVLPIGASRYRLKPADWNASMPDHGEGSGLYFDGERSFPENWSSAIAIQAACLGHYDFALRVWRTPEQVEAFDSGWFGSPADESATAAAALLIATHLVNESMKVGADGPAILAQLRKLDGLGLVVNGKDKHPLTTLATLIEPSFKPSAAPEGSVQRAVDELVNYRGVHPGEDSESDPRYLKVKALGLQAVPALAEVLKSKTVTHCYVPRFDNYYPHMLALSEVAQALITDISGGEVWAMTPEGVTEWYKMRLAGKVDSWLLDNVVETVAFGGPAYRRANRDAFDAISTAHPELYEQAVRKVVSMKPKIGTWGALAYLKEVKLPEETKRRILKFIAENGDLDDKESVMDVFRTLEPALYDQMILDALASFPHTSEQYAGDARLRMSGFAQGTTNPAVEKAYRRALKVCDTSQRMYLLYDLGQVDASLEPFENKKRNLAMLRDYFEDKSLPQVVPNDPRFKYFFWATEPPTPVWHVAVQTACYLLGLDHSPEPTDSEWQELRRIATAMVDGHSLFGAP